MKPFITALQILPSLNHGGVERSTLDLAKGLCEKYPHTPHYVASAGGHLVSQLQDKGATHIELPLHTKSPFGIYQNIQRLSDLIQTKHIQLIHARSRAPAWSALKAARLSGVPLITTYHGVYNSSNMLKSFYNSVMARGDRVIAVSQYVYDHIHKHYPQFAHNVVLIRNGVDIDYFDPSRIDEHQKQELRQKWQVPPHHKLILLPARLTRLKGHTVLLKALHAIDHTKMSVVFLGNSNRIAYQQELQAIAQNLPIRFISSCDQMPIAYAAADLVLSCSTEPESFGRVAAEALSMGRPFIGTAHGATPELCIDGQTGFLVPPGNVEALARRINATKPLENQAREHVVRHFSLTRMVNETLALYQNCKQY